MTSETAAPGRFDVIVIGSGAAGMTCALTAAEAGLKVLVVEKSALVGGTSAMSGAGIWAPANHLATAAGIDDSPEEALRYFENALPGLSNRFRAHWQALCRNSGPMLRLVEKSTRLRFALTPEPDPIDVEGAKTRGRMVSPLALPRKEAGSFARRLRPSTLPHLFTYHEMFSPNPWGRPFHTLWKMGPELARRWIFSIGGQGSALMAGLIGGFLRLGGEIRTGQDVRALLRDAAGRVNGLRLADGSVISATRGILLATGGFEWDTRRYAQNFPGKTDWLCTPDTNTGGAVDLALAVGAALDQMQEANVHPALPTRYEGRAHGMPVAWHVGPHGIIVNDRAQRFVSEYDYNLGAALNARDPAGNPLHQEAWVICDRRFLYRSLPFAWYALRARGWVRRGRSLAELAVKTGLDPAELQATVTKFNSYCRDNHDPEFHRGEPLWERFRSGNWKDGEKNAALGGIGKGPFYAMPVNRSILGTKGGPLTDAAGRVLTKSGEVIPGLYAAGNAMANPIGTRAVGAGTTVGPHMTMGYICAQDMIAPSA